MSTTIRNRLEPARTVVTRIGGVRATARILDIAPSAVSRWMLPRAKGGTNGAVPLKHWQRLLNHAKRESIPLTVNDLTTIKF
ncbi:MAG: hypothetical protein ACK53W_00310 [Gemmatimonadota bacterium]|jgi:hypothetical protein